MKFLNMVGIKLIDLMILVGLLALIAFNSTGPIALPQLFITIAVVYFIVVIVVNILCRSIAGDHILIRIARTAISGLLIIAIFDWTTGPLQWILNVTITPNTKQILFYGAMARGLTKAFLNRHFDMLP